MKIYNSRTNKKNILFFYDFLKSLIRDTSHLKIKSIIGNETNKNNRTPLDYNIKKKYKINNNTLRLRKKSNRLK